MAGAAVECDATDDTAVSLLQPQVSRRTADIQPHATGVEAIGELAGAEVSWVAHAMPALNISYAGARREWTAMASTKSRAHHVVNEFAAYTKYAVALTACFVLLREVLAELGCQSPSCRRIFPVQVAFVALALLMYMDFAVLIPISYDLASAMGGGTASSGWLISFKNAGVMLGGGLGFVLSKALRHGPKRRIVVAALCACAVTYALLAAALLSCSGPAGGDCALTFKAVLGARMSAGFLQGLTVMYDILARELTPEEQQVSLSMWENFSISGGVCVGPFVFSLTVLMVGGRGELASGGAALSAFEKTAAALGTFAILFAALAATVSVVTPHDVSALERRDGACVGEAPAGSAAMSPHMRARLWTLGLVIMFLGALGYSAVEAGSSLLLETSFGWAPDAIGFALACSFGVAAAVSLSINATRELLFSSLQALVGLSALGVLGSLCFLDVGAGSAARILAGDCMLYPGLLTVNGLLEGYLYILARPGTWFSTDCTVLAVYLLDQAGRFLATPLARGVLAHAGRTPYALSQGALICLIACLGYMVVHAVEHGASACGPNAHKSSSA